jgi:DNA primase
MRLDPSKISEIVDACRIEEVVGDYISLKKRGANLLGLCPFHNEKTPSFNVSPAKGIYKCFGCGKAGNAVTFVMEYEHLDYIQALKQLAEKYGIEWPEFTQTDSEWQEERQKASERESLQILNAFAENYFIQNLNTDEGKTIGLSYFTERGFRKDIIEKFKLGYSIDAWSDFYDNAIKNGFSEDVLLSSGLVKSGEQQRKRYDAYRGRVIFPIHSISGKPIAFAGRFLKPDPKSPKYVNSPETLLYHKSNELYGLFFAKNQILKSDFVYLVEGYTDVISMHQAGVQNVVASSGTSLTEQQVKLIKRFTDNICVLYDGDQAGIKASLRGIDMLLEGGLNVKVLLFPDGEDPDSYYKKNGEQAFANLLEQSKKDFIQFKASLLMQDAGNDPLQKADLLRSIVETITKIPDAIKRSLYLRETAKLMQTEEQLLINESNKLLRNKRNAPASPNIITEETTNLPEISEADALMDEYLQERDLVRLILKFGGKPFEGYINAAHFILHSLHDAELEISDPLLQEFFNDVNANIEREHFDVKFFTHHHNPMISAMSATIIAERNEISPHWNKRFDEIIDIEGSNYIQDIHSALNRVKLKHIEKLIFQNQQQLKTEIEQNNLDEIQTLQQIHQHLLEERIRITQLTKTVIVR